MREALFVVTVLAVVASATAAGDVLPPAEAGSTAKSCVDWWTTKNLRVGHPNVLNRGDRTTMRFDLSPYLTAGRVTRAELCLALNHYGITNANGFVAHRLVCDREEIRPVDTLSDDTEELGRFVVRSGDEKPARRRIDVTDAVNGLLETGHVNLVVRIRDATVEKYGNPGRRPEGGELVKEELRLEIER